MRPLLKYLLPLLFALNTSAQVNLVPNPSFEECYVCNRHLLSDVYVDTAYIPFIKNWFYAKASPDYFNKNNIDNNVGGCWGLGGHTPPNSGYGFQYPRTDSSYIGVATYAGNWEYFPPYDYNYYKEWIGVKLIEPLKSGICYEFTMYVSRAEKSRKIAASLGAFFTTDSIWESPVPPIHIIPPFDSSQVQVHNDPWNVIYHDTINWVPISGIFRAQGGEQFMYLGNMLINGQYPIVTVNDPAHPDNGSCTNSYFFIDDVSLYEYKQPCAVEVKENKPHQIILFPNPAANILTISSGNLQNAQVELFDISGRKLFQQNLTASQQSIDFSGYANGIYLCAITANGKVVKREKVVISR